MTRPAVQPDPVEPEFDHQHPLYRPLVLAVRAADEAFQKAGDAGTKTWLDDYFLPELTEHGLTVEALSHSDQSATEVERRLREVAVAVVEGRGLDALLKAQALVGAHEPRNPVISHSDQSAKQEARSDSEALRHVLSEVAWDYHSEGGHPDPQNMCPEPTCQAASIALATRASEPSVNDRGMAGHAVQSWRDNGGAKAGCIVPNCSYKAKPKRHHVIPLLTISQRDGLQDYRCLECGKPVAKDRRGWRHAQHERWPMRTRRRAA